MNNTIKAQKLIECLTKKDLKIKISGQANKIINNVENFNVDHFATWLEKKGFIIGGQKIFEYLEKGMGVKHDK
jgi:hypothetical protein